MYRKREHDNNNNASEVASHYNSRPDFGKRARVNSRILSLKNFNNWVKSVLINKYCKKYSTVLDIAGGKGGDLLKWTKAGINNLVLADIAEKSVLDAIRRYNELEDPPMAARFIAADCSQPGILKSLPSEVLFDFVSCQFAFHYSFETEAKVRGMLDNITTRLKPGGIFIGTIPNSNWLVKKLRSIPGKSFGNDIYSVEFENKENFPRFGAKYWFTLEESVDHCPEFLVHLPTLKMLAAEYGLELVYKASFHQFYEDHKEPYSDLFHRMKVLNRSGTVSQQEWEVAGLYLCFVFQKKGESPAPDKDFRPLGNPRHVSPSELIVIRE